MSFKFYFIAGLIGFYIQSVSNAESGIINSDNLTCDSNFISSYYAKKECLINNEPNACINLAILHKITRASSAGVAGAYLAETLDSLTSKDRYFINFNAALSKIRDIQTNHFKAHDLVNKIYDEEMNRLSNGQFKTLGQFQRHINSIPDEIFTDEIEKKFLNLSNMTYNNGDTHLRTLAGSYNEPFKSHILSAINGFESYRQLKVQTESVLKEHYPKEFKKLNNLYKNEKRLSDAFETAWKNYNNDEKALNKNISFMKSEKGINQFRELTNMRKRISTLISKDPNLSIVNSLLQIGRDSDMESGHPIISESKSAMKSNRANRSLKGLGWGIAGELAVETVADYVIHTFKYTSELNKCAKQLSLTSPEVRFLTEYQIIGEPNIKYNGSELFDKDCRRFKLNISEETLREAIAEKGDLPFGLCQMMHKEIKQFDHLVPQKIEKTISCEDEKYIYSDNVLNDLHRFASWANENSDQQHIIRDNMFKCLDNPFDRNCQRAKRYVQINLNQSMKDSICPALTHPFKDTESLNVFNGIASGK